jgi:hypothetical protein
LRYLPEGIGNGGRIVLDLGSQVTINESQRECGCLVFHWVGVLEGKLWASLQPVVQGNNLGVSHGCAPVLR